MIDYHDYILLFYFIFRDFDNNWMYISLCSVGHNNNHHQTVYLYIIAYEYMNWTKSVVQCVQVSIEIIRQTLKKNHEQQQQQKTFLGSFGISLVLVHFDLIRFAFKAFSIPVTVVELYWRKSHIAMAIEWLISIVKITKIMQRNRNVDHIYYSLWVLQLLPSFQSRAAYDSKSQIVDKSNCLLTMQN